MWTLLSIVCDLKMDTLGAYQILLGAGPLVRLSTFVCYLTEAFVVILTLEGVSPTGCIHEHVYILI